MTSDALTLERKTDAVTPKRKTDTLTPELLRKITPIGVPPTICLSARFISTTIRSCGSR